MTTDEIKSSIIQNQNLTRWETDLAVTDNRRLRPGRQGLIAGREYKDSLAAQKMILMSKLKNPTKNLVEVKILVPKSKHDVGSFSKWILDAMNGSVYVDDRQVESYSVKRDHLIDRVMVYVREIHEIKVREIGISRRGNDSLPKKLITAAAD